MALRLKAITEAHPGALCQILQFFQARNVVPRTVVSERLGAEYLEVTIEIAAAELPADHFHVIVAKINELSVTLTACHVPA